MLNRVFVLYTCAFALACAACGGGSEATGTGSETTPAAAAGEPATPSSGGEALPPPEPEPAAQVQPEPQAPPPFGAMIIHKVKDYEAWKTGFEAGAEARKQASFAGHTVMRGVDDQNLVLIWSPFSDSEKAKAFMADKSLKDKMKQAGVIGKPQVQLASVVSTQMDPRKQTPAGALVVTKVKDFEAFKTDFESGAQARTDAGIAGYALSQDLADKSVAYVYLQSADPAKLKSYVEAKETKAAWKTAGVAGPAKITLVQEVEMVTYP
jgi:quinol monooxygenase YgiN